MTAEPPRAAPRRLSRLAVIAGSTALFVALGWFWAVATPPTAGPDEPAHAVYAASLWRGQLRGHDVVSEFPGDGPGSVSRITLTHVRVPRAYLGLQTLANCYRANGASSAACAPAVGRDTTIAAGDTYVGTYPPLYYLLVGWPTRLLSPARALLAMRLVSAALCALLFGVGIGSAHRAARSPFTVLAAVLVATPAALFLTGVVNPSALEIAAGFATWFGLVEVVRHEGRPSVGLVTQVAVCASLFALSRPLSPVFLAVAVAAVLLTIGPKGIIAASWRDRRVRTGAIVVVVVTVLGGVWILAARSYDAFAGVSIPGLSWHAALHQSADRWWPLRADEAIGDPAGLGAKIPDFMFWLWSAAVAAVVVAALVIGSWRQRVGLVLTAAVVLVVPLVADVTRAPTYGFIWQGRYSLPIAMGLPILAAWILADSGRLAQPVRHAAMVAVAVGAAAVQVVAFLEALSRMTQGVGHPLLRALTNAQWAPAVSPKVLFGGMVAAGVFSAVWMAFVGTDEPATVSVSATADPTEPEP